MKYNPRLDLFNERLGPVCVSDVTGTISDTLVKVAIWSAVDSEDRSAGWVF